MKSIKTVTSAGPDGPTYIRFSDKEVASTAPSAHEELIVDYDASGRIVGIELISLGPDAFEALAGVAKKNELDLSPLFARPFTKELP